jgi:mRNA interferase ChpB
MTRRKIPQRGDVYWIDPNPVEGREMKNRHRYVVITPGSINALGISMTVPITSGGVVARNLGFTAVISGHDTNGVAVCHQVRSFDIEERVRQGTAKFIESLDEITMDEIIGKVVSLIECD